MSVGRTLVPSDEPLVPRADRLWRVVLRGIDIDDERRALLQAADAIVPVPRVSGVDAKYLASLD